MFNFNGGGILGNPRFWGAGLGGWNDEGDFWNTDPGPIPAPGGYPGPYMEDWSGKPPPSMGGQFGHPGGGGPGPMNLGGPPGPDGGNGRWGGGNRWDGPGHWGGGNGRWGGGGGGNGRWGGRERYDPNNAANNLIGPRPRPGGIPAPGGYNSNWKSGFGHPGGGAPGPANMGGQFGHPGGGGPGPVNFGGGNGRWRRGGVLGML